MKTRRQELNELDRELFETYEEFERHVECPEGCNDIQCITAKKVLRARLFIEQEIEKLNKKNAQARARRQHNKTV